MSCHVHTLPIPLYNKGATMKKCKKCEDRKVKCNGVFTRCFLFVKIQV